MTDPTPIPDRWPDPSIAPGADPDNPAAPDDRPDVAVRNAGADTTVVGVGNWPAGTCRRVPAWLADRLLQSARFVRDDQPDTSAEDPPSKVSPAGRARGGKPQQSGDEHGDLPDTDPAHVDN